MEIVERNIRAGGLLATPGEQCHATVGVGGVDNRVDLLTVHIQRQRSVTAAIRADAIGGSARGDRAGGLPGIVVGEEDIVLRHSRFANGVLTRAGDGEVIRNIGDLHVADDAERAGRISGVVVGGDFDVGVLIILGVRGAPHEIQVAGNKEVQRVAGIFNRAVGIGAGAPLLG